MEKELLDNIILLAGDEKVNGTVSKRIANTSCDMVCKVNDEYYEDKDKVKRGLLLSSAFVSYVRALFKDLRETKKREKLAAKLFSISQDKVTGDLNTFISSKDMYPIYVNDFQFDALVSRDRMSNLNVIWGNANLQKLHDFKYLENLKIVMGNVYTSDAINTNGLNSLEVVTGDLHVEELDCIDEFKNLIYVGGKIYNKDKVMTLDEIRQTPKQFVK